VLRRIFRRKREREEVIGDWRKLHNDEIHNLYSSQNIIRGQIKDEIRGEYSTHGRDKKCIQNFGRKASKEEAAWET
jgi:hypothetical protein